MPFNVTAATDIAPEQLSQFFRRVFSPEKSAFLIAHDDWLLKGRENRLVIVDDHRVVGSSALIPAGCLVAGREHRAAWRVDLIVLPEYRGRGLQRALDREMQFRFDVLLGFPNAVATRIHRKHGWGVRYGRVLLLPLRPSRLRAISRLPQWPRRVGRGAARMLDPIAAIAARAYHRSPHVGRVPFDAAAFARLFAATSSALVATTARTIEHFEWRFQQSPFRDQLAYYAARSDGQIKMILICRIGSDSDSRAFRILDIFGDLADVGLLGQLIATAVSDARDARCDQVTAVAFRPAVLSAFTRAGFVLRSSVSFSWQAKDPAIVDTLAKCELDWTLADSDNDEVT